MDGHSIVINKIAPEGSICEICGKPAPWQMYCKDCDHILRFYCDEHAYLSQGNIKLENAVKKADTQDKLKKIENQIKNAQNEWQAILKNIYISF